MGFNTFDEVVKWYTNTKPLVSCHHTLAEDVRPIGSRKRKWERIKKIDDNTYALLDGTYGGTMYASNPLRHGVEAHAYENTMAPITWIRRECGDYIRIRNHRVNVSSVTRYNFLQYNLPMGMGFRYKNGKHSVTSRGEVYALPKCTVQYDHVSHTMSAEDGIYLMFRVNGDGTFTRVGDTLKVITRHIDRDTKREWRDDLAEFYNYCGAIAPIVDISWQGLREYSAQANAWATEVSGKPVYIHTPRGVSTIPEWVLKGVVQDTEHPIRVAIAALVIHCIGGKRRICNESDLRSIKAAYNRFMNSGLGFFRTVEV